MSRPRFLADEDLRRVIVNAVQGLEPAIEFVCAQDVGLSGQEDDSILAYAAREGLLVVSHDVNTMPAAAHARLAIGQPMFGLLLAAQEKPTRTIAESLLLIWSASDAEEYDGMVKYLPL